ncbi:hypothetical protein LTR48_000032 [Friedmanniomyces endolithicus]|uniref:Uncharacterized protein n=1 Tax=Rachicladosporium monterosium TaxID=1507873 RepID=A0ABR0LH48_9PEZI|nr:hypothetical protein LTR29_000323 [Friedmanniomyces endolithicus]KAK1089746.1 hypothetical protein LTR48_000032 [Friedmanniomyces endolithicus]KAK5148687.1 hypothetical protein LTR32_000045 [Rachicladosporium monterosium]
MTRVNPRTLKIYHSCEPPGAPVLLRFKAGTHTLYHPFLDPHASAPLVWIPKRKGAAELVRRCVKGGCEVCAATEDVGDLTLEVAMAHGIRGVALKPSPRARTVGERVADGGVRGAWMFGGGVLGAGRVGGGFAGEVEWERFGGGDGSGQVGRWLKGLPREFERWEAGSLGGSPSEGTREEGLGVEGDGRLDEDLPVAERLRDFFARRDELERRFAEAARSQTRALETRAGAGGAGPGVKGESQLGSGLPVGERLRDFFARRDELERRFAEAARSQTRALEAEWRKSFKSSAAAPWKLPSPPVLDAARWDVNIANSQLAYRLQSQVTALLQGPFEADMREYTKPITYPNKFNNNNNPPLARPPLRPEPSVPFKPFITDPHHARISLPFIPSGTTEANIQYYIKDLEAYMSARGFTSLRQPTPPPPPPPVNQSAPTPGINLTTTPAAHKGVDQTAAAPPPFAPPQPVELTRRAAPGAGVRPGTNLTQRTPGLAHPVFPAASSLLGTKRTHEDIGPVAQERRQKIRRMEVQLGT